MFLCRILLISNVVDCFFYFPCVLCWLVDLISLFLIVVVVFLLSVCVCVCGSVGEKKIVSLEVGLVFMASFWWF